MKKQTLALLMSTFLLFESAATVSAEKIDVTGNPSGKIVTIPARAVEVTPGVFSLGQAIDPLTGQLVDGLAIVHYKAANARSSQAKTPKGTTACYSYLASGVKWKSIEPWTMNTANGEGLAGQELYEIMANGIDKWEDAADGITGNGSGVNILGLGTSTTSPLEVDTIAPDEINEVYLGSVAETDAIAVTTVWGIFSGAPQQRKLVGWDMVFDQDDYDWAVDGNVNKMDFENIATHELGHAVGLADLYNSSCSQETMFGYASKGQINKRDLGMGDILGISNLY